MSDETVPVLIVGGGPVGLSAALFLAHHGVRSILLERHPGTSLHPRTKGINIRTMELFRSLGLEEAIRHAGASLTQSNTWLFVETLVGKERRRVSRRSLFELPEDLRHLSPTHWVLCAQNQLEPLLVAMNPHQCSDLRFGSELVSFAQDSRGVTASVKVQATGEERTIRADYLIAADGAYSPIRRTLDIATTGARTLAHNINIYFRANLSALVQDRWFSMCFVHNPDIQGILAAVNNRDLWNFHVRYHPDGETADFSTECCREYICKAVGLPSLPVEILSVLPYEAAVRVADRFQDGRVFLAGDAAHTMPPAGAFGMNTGIQDAHNLAWKLALVLKGDAGPALLRTYEAERRPVALFTTEQAGLRYGNQEVAGTARSVGPARADDLVVMLGYRYTSPAIVAEESTDFLVNTLDLTGRSGTRAPHVWLEHQGQRLSTIDLFDKHFVLLAGKEGKEWCDVARAVATRLRIDLQMYSVGAYDTDLIDAEGRWNAAYDVSSRGAVVVRPDGFVGWRSSRYEPPSQETVEKVLLRLLCK